MKKIRTLSLILALLLLLTLTACSDIKNEEASTVPTESTPPTPLDIIVEVQQNMAAASSISVLMDMELSMEVMEQSMDLSTKMAVDMTKNPIAMKCDTEMNMGVLGAVNTLMYVEETADGLIGYTKTDDRWVKQTIDSKALAQYDGLSAITTYMDSTESLTPGATETVNGIVATRYDCKIAKEKLEDVFKASGTLEQFADLGITVDESLFEGMENLTYSFWIDEERLLPVKCVIDLTDYMNALISGVPGSNGSVSVATTLITLTYTGFNHLAPIEIPEEARSAS